MSHDISHGMSHGMAAPSYSFTNKTSASSARSANFNESNQLYKNVLEQANGHRIEKVSKDEYIIHYSDNYRRIFKRDPDMFGFITVTNNTGRQNKTENDFDRQISKLIDSRMRTSETSLSELLELCTILYSSMFKRDIPIEKLSELKQDIMSNPISRKNRKNIIFRKL